MKEPTRCRIKAQIIIVQNKCTANGLYFGIISLRHREISQGQLETRYRKTPSAALKAAEQICKAYGIAYHVEEAT